MGGEGLPDVRRRSRNAGPPPRQKRLLDNSTVPAPRDAPGINFPKAVGVTNLEPHPAGPYARWPNPYDVNPYLKLYDNEHSSIRVPTPGRHMILRLQEKERPQTSTDVSLVDTTEPFSRRPKTRAGVSTRPAPPARDMRPRSAHGHAQVRGRLAASWAAGRVGSPGLPFSRAGGHGSPILSPCASPQNSPGRLGTPPRHGSPPPGVPGSPPLDTQVPIHDMDPSELVAVLSDKKGDGHIDEFISALRDRGQGDVTGFEDIARSLNRLLRGSDAGLARRWKELSLWLDKFHVDKCTVQLAHNCEYLLEQAYRADLSRGRKHPNPGTTRIALVILEQLLNVLTIEQPVLGEVIKAVRTEVVDAILLSGVPEVTELPDMSSVEDKADLTRLVADAEERFQTRMYYAVVREIAGRIGKAEEEILREEQIRQKQMAVMDRHEKVLAAKNQELAEERAQMEKLKQDFKSSMLALDERTERLEQELEVMRQRLKAKDAEMGEIKGTQHKIVRQMEDAYTDRDRMQRDLYRRDDALKTQTGEIYALDELLEELVRDKLQGPAWEVQLQEQTRSFIDNPADFQRAGTLVAWYNAVMTFGSSSISSIASPKGSQSTRLRSFSDANVLDTHILVLSCIAPSQVNSGGIVQDTPLKKAVSIHQTLESLRIECPEPDLLVREPHSGLYNLRVAAAVFERISDSALASIRGQPQLMSAQEGIRLEHLLSPRQTGPGGKKMPRSATEWTQVVDEAQKRQAKWRAAASYVKEMVWNAGQAALEGTESTLAQAESDRQVREEFALHPFREGTRTFASVKKSFAETIEKRVGEREEVSTFMMANYRFFHDVFNTYTGGRSRLTLDDACRLVTDIRISTRAMPRDRVAEMFDDGASAGSGG
eukprot:Hpha_TRINITY_DN1823_c0_g1::TRINITY_DN1823_c0_g1_i2::g.170590::m.170590